MGKEPAAGSLLVRCVNPTTVNLMGYAMKREEIKDLDSLWATVVKEKAKWKCEYCERYNSRMEAAHVVGRRHRTTRWGMMREGRYDLCGHCLCHTCHQEYDEHGPLEPRIVEKVVGHARKLQLQIAAKTRVAKWQEFDKIATILEGEGAALDDSPYA